MRGLSSTPPPPPPRVIFCRWIFFSRSKASDANIDIIANVVCLWKTRIAVPTKASTRTARLLYRWWNATLIVLKMYCKCLIYPHTKPSSFLLFTNKQKALPFTCSYSNLIRTNELISQEFSVFSLKVSVLKQLGL